jgi:hypothetical protein
MNKLCISDITTDFTIDSLTKYILQSQEIEFIVYCSSFGSANSNLDIAEDYLFALFLGESIHPFCKSAYCKVQSSSICFIVNINNAQDFASSIFQLLNEDQDMFEHSLRTFEANLNKYKIFFHDLADSYMANWIAGIEDLSLNEGDIEDIYRRYPEQKFGFWRSFVSHHIGYDVYTSPWAWIIPYNEKQGETPHNLNSLLLTYGGFGEIPIVEESINFSLGNLHPVVVNSSTIMRFPEKGFRKAQVCAASIIKEDNFLFSQSYSDERMSFKILTSEDGGLMIILDRLAQYIFFANNRFYSSDTGLTFTSINLPVEQDYQSGFDKLSDIFGSLAGNNIDISCPWEKIDDEKFEQLCYDLVSYSSNFDPDSRQKMGKSRSRDGGRDIEVYTHERLGKPRAKWIVQCKLLTGGKSLSGSKVQVSDVIDQYGAEGFFVMTSGVIDATLHDKLNDIGRNRNIEIKRWDYLQIERILAKPKYKNIRKRYFGEKI